MASYKAIIQSEAQKDLDSAYQYFEEQKPGLGFLFLETIASCVEVLEENPFLFQKVYGELRRAVILRFGFNIIFKVAGTNVYILALIHGSRNPEKWEERK